MFAQSTLVIHCIYTICHTHTPSNNTYTYNHIPTYPPPPPPPTHTYVGTAEGHRKSIEAPPCDTHPVPMYAVVDIDDDPQSPNESVCIVCGVGRWNTQGMCCVCGGVMLYTCAILFTPTPLFPTPLFPTPPYVPLHPNKTHTHQASVCTL